MSIKGLIEATGIVLGLVLIIGFLILAIDALGLKNNQSEVLLGALVVTVILWRYRHNTRKLFSDTEDAINGMFKIGSGIITSSIALLFVGFLYIGLPLASIYIIVKIAKFFWYH